MNQNLAQTAINLALKCEWLEAIKVNKQILNEDDTDTEALNRLARAYYESGDTKKAKTTSNKVLKLEPSNKIAQKALERYKQSLPLHGKYKSGSQTSQLTDSNFLEESGKTKLTNLLNLGSDKTISCLDSGDEVIISSHSHRVTVNTMDGKYIGKLPDDLSAKLRILVKGGNKYKVLIKSVGKSAVMIFIKEVERGKDFKNVQSFTNELLEPISEFSS